MNAPGHPNCNCDVWEPWSDHFLIGLQTSSQIANVILCLRKHRVPPELRRIIFEYITDTKLLGCILSLGKRIPVRVHEAMKDIEHIDYDIFKLEEVTSVPLIYTSVYFIFHKWWPNLSKLNPPPDPQKIIAFIIQMQSLHRYHPYHNALHAADTLRCMSYLLTEVLFPDQIRPHRLLACLLACVSGHAGHPGPNNVVINQTRGDTNIIHGCNGAVEKHRVALVLSCLHNPFYDVTVGWSRSNRVEFYSIITDMIMATEMATHQRFFVRVKNFLDENPPLAWNIDVELNKLFFGCLLKFARWGNCWSNRDSHMKWVHGLVNTLYAQGDVSSAFGLTRGLFMDRSQFPDDIRRMCVAFVSYIVIPFVDTFKDHFEGIFFVIKDKVDEILRFWEAVQSVTDVVSWTPDPPFPCLTDRTAPSVSMRRWASEGTEWSFVWSETLVAWSAAKRATPLSNAALLFPSNWLDDSNFDAYSLYNRYMLKKQNDEAPVFLTSAAVCLFHAHPEITGPLNLDVSEWEEWCRIIECSWMEKSNIHPTLTIPHAVNMIHFVSECLRNGMGQQMQLTPRDLLGMMMIPIIYGAGNTGMTDEQHWEHGTALHSLYNSNINEKYALSRGMDAMRYPPADVFKHMNPADRASLIESTLDSLITLSSKGLTQKLRLMGPRKMDSITESFMLRGIHASSVHIFLGLGFRRYAVKSVGHFHTWWKMCQESNVKSGRKALQAKIDPQELPYGWEIVHFLDMEVLPAANLCREICSFTSHFYTNAERIRNHYIF